MHFLEMIKAFETLAWCTFTPRILQAAQSKHTLPAYTSHLQDCCNICQTAHQLPTFYAKRPSLTHVTHLYKKNMYIQETQYHLLPRQTVQTIVNCAIMAPVNCAIVVRKELKGFGLRFFSL